MQEELKVIQRQVGTTFVHVTHDQEEAMAIADRIVVMNSGQIEDAGPPSQVYNQPATLFTADFMGEMNHIPAQIKKGKASTNLGTLPAQGMPDGAATLCIRPETIHADGRGLSLGTAQVKNVTFFGAHIRVILASDEKPDLTLLAHLPPGDMPKEGSKIPLSVDANALRFYPECC
jgi:spermidine/putrescine transport system ATP-binding protein